MITSHSSVSSPVQSLPHHLRRQPFRDKLERILPKGFAPPAAGRGMLVVIDPSVEHGDALATGVIKGARRLMLNAKQDSITQITEAMHRTWATSLHIVTHGSPGCLHFSSGDLTLANLPRYASHLESWFRYRPFYRHSSMKVHSHESFLSLYACNLAKGEAGQTFIEHLHYLVGVSVHAAQGKVGSKALNGSWQLDVAHPFPHQAKFPFTDDLLETYESVV